MRYLIVLEPTEAGFAVQVPDLAISTHGENLEAAKQAARLAISINLETYKEIGQALPDKLPVEQHLENPDFEDGLFAYIDVADGFERDAA
jgi:predicted RNase H-like HicB family nuclease